MDPNKTLKSIRALLKQIEHIRTSEDLSEDGVYESLEECCLDLAATVEDLDSWLSSGGFLPEDWSQ